MQSWWAEETSLKIKYLTNPKCLKVCVIIQYSLHVWVWFIVLFIHTQVFPVSAVTLRDHYCRGEFNGSHFLLLFPVISCGTEGEMDEVNGRVHYTNTVRDTLFNIIVQLVWPWSTKAVLSRWGIFVIAKNTLHGSNIFILFLCQKSLGYLVKIMFHEDTLYISYHKYIKT